MQHTNKPKKRVLPLGISGRIHYVDWGLDIQPIYVYAKASGS